MHTKKLIAYLLDHQVTKENIHYQKIRKLYGSDIEVRSVKLTEHNTYYGLEISFLSDIRTFGLCKGELDFGKIIMTKYYGKVDPLLSIVGFIRIQKADLGDLSEDFLHSRGDKETKTVRIPGPLTNDPGGTKTGQLKKLEKY